MNCATARELLSAFHDHELQPELEAEVQDHIGECVECAKRLTEFGELSRMASELRNRGAPASVWPDLKSKLDEAPQTRPTPTVGSIRRQRRMLGLAIAASLVLGLVSWGLLVRWRQSDEHGQDHISVAANFGRYLNEFDQNPERAQLELLSNYDGRAVDLDEAARTLRYPPVAPDMLPNGFARDGVYLLKMPCCLCVQTIYKNEAGARLVVFEHVDDQPLWFGDRPIIKAQCHGMPTSLVQVDDRLAATWKRHERFITLIGLRGVEEVSQLVAFFDQVESAHDRL